VGLSATIALAASGQLTKDLDLSSPGDSVGIGQGTFPAVGFNLADGTGNLQAKSWWHDKRTVAAGATDSIDLNGSLTGPLGDAVNWTTVRLIVVAIESPDGTKLLRQRGTTRVRRDRGAGLPGNGHVRRPAPPLRRLGDYPGHGRPVAGQKPVGRQRRLRHLDHRHSVEGGPMALASGSEGTIKLGAVELTVTDWERNSRPETAMVTAANTGGRKRRKMVVKDDEFTFTVLWDSTDTPESVDLEQGLEVTGAFRIGSSAFQYAAVPLYVDNVVFTGCSQTGVVSYKVTAYVNGTWAAAVTAWP
jgi:hypothetical protein